MSDLKTELITDHGLSRREADVVTQVARGLTNKEAAYNLNVSEATVKFHLNTVYRKLGFTKRRDLLLKFMAKALLEGGAA